VWGNTGGSTGGSTAVIACGQRNGKTTAVIQVTDTYLPTLILVSAILNTLITAVTVILYSTLLYILRPSALLKRWFSVLKALVHLLR
jgi:hypothetical protein